PRRDPGRDADGAPECHRAVRARGNDQGGGRRAARHSARHGDVAPSPSPRRIQGLRAPEIGSRRPRQEGKMSTHDSELPEWTDEERALLGSAQDDTPPSGSLKASLKAVAGLGAAGSAATLSKAAAAVAHAKPAAALGLVKWAGIVVVGGAVATAAGVAVH